MPLDMVSTKRIAIAGYVWFIYVPNKTLQQHWNLASWSDGRGWELSINISLLSMQLVEG